MKSLTKNVAAGFATVFLLIALSACQKQEGPAERAGKQIDKAVDTVGEHIEDAGKKLQDTAKGDKK